MSQNSTTWRTPVMLLVLCAVPFLGSGPPDAQSLLSKLRSGECDALPLLSTHHPEQLTLELMRELASHEDLILRELVGHQDWAPHIKLQDQLAIAAKLEPDHVQRRAMIWITRRTTSREALTQEDVASYWKTRTP